jgi:hypothetical protein
VYLAPCPTERELNELSNIWTRSVKWTVGFETTENEGILDARKMVVPGMSSADTCRLMCLKIVRVVDGKVLYCYADF